MLCSKVNTGGALNKAFAGPKATEDKGIPNAINGISVPDMYVAFAKASIHAIANDDFFTESLIRLENNSPTNTVVPTALNIKVIEPITEEIELFTTSSLVNILNGFGNFIFSLFLFRRIVFLP